MDRVAQNKQRTGFVTIPAAKSWAHRILITAALAKENVKVLCEGISDDIQATIDCLSALGADFDISDGEINVSPIRELPTSQVHLYCKESGSTLRFLLPVVGALGVNGVFHMEGRLKDRPLTELSRELSKNGMEISLSESLLYVKGKLKPGAFSLPGDVSSQYISGLLMALYIVEGDSVLEVTGEIQSEKYIQITEQALKCSGADIIKNGNIYTIHSMQRFQPASSIVVEGDWSSAAFFLGMGALSEKGICINALNLDSIQGDKAMLDVLASMGAEVSLKEDAVFVKKGNLKGITVDASQIPDLVPVIAAIASLCRGETHIVNAGRLRFKESDRIVSTVAMIRSVGGEVTELEDGMIIEGSSTLRGGVVDSYKDHRIAMAASVIAMGCENAVVIKDAQCTNKSFPDYWDRLDRLMIAE